MTATVASRRRALRRLITDGVVSNQHELVERLADHGYDVTQPTVSRDLEAIGAIRAVENGGVRYVIGSAPESGVAELARVFREFVLWVEATGNLVVLRTPPGAAHLVASAIDTASLNDIVGTVAGDDTVFIAAAEGVGGAGLAAKLDRLGAP